MAAGPAQRPDFVARFNEPEQPTVRRTWPLLGWTAGGQGWRPATPRRRGAGQGPCSRRVQILLKIENRQQRAIDGPIW